MRRRPIRRAAFNVYWNLHRKVWSLKRRGKVERHAGAVLLEDVAFKVSEPGRQRVLRERRKNVHAYASGDVVGTWPKNAPLDARPSVFFKDAVRVSYNPFKGATFVEAETGRPVVGATLALLTTYGHVLAPRKGLKFLEPDADKKA